jgi:hypothetical protein
MKDLRTHHEDVAIHDANLLTFSHPLSLPLNASINSPCVRASTEFETVCKRIAIERGLKSAGPPNIKSYEILPTPPALGSSGSRRYLLKSRMAGLPALR